MYGRCGHVRRNDGSIRSGERPVVHAIIAFPGPGSSKVGYGRPAEDAKPQLQEAEIGETVENHAALTAVRKNLTPSQEAVNFVAKLK